MADEMQAPSLSFDPALADLAALFLKLALAQTLPGTLAEDPERSRLAGLAERIDPESVQLYYQIALQGREDLPLAPDEHGGFGMTLLRMLPFRPPRAGQAIEKPPPAKRPASKNEKPKSETPKAAAPPRLAQLGQQIPGAGAPRQLAR